MGETINTGAKVAVSCGRCPKCNSSAVETLDNGRCHCTDCANTWSPYGANYTVESSR